MAILSIDVDGAVDVAVDGAAGTPGRSARCHPWKRDNQGETTMTMSAEPRTQARSGVAGRHDLIGSDRVEGTNVYRSDGKKIGEIERVMIDKISGQAAYAVLGFGGFLGLGEDHYPVPWQRLTYNERLGGYEVNISDEQLKNAPKFATGEEWKWDTTQGNQVYRYYGVPPYWI
jgi:hypothetical protein